MHLAKFPFIDALKLHAIAGPQGKIFVLHIDEFQRRAADDIPAAGPRLRVDARLPARQTDAPFFHPQAWRRQAWHAGKFRGQITQIRKAGTEADRIYHVDHASVQRDDGIAREMRELLDALEVEPE